MVEAVDHEEDMVEVEDHEEETEEEEEVEADDVMITEIEEEEIGKSIKNEYLFLKTIPVYNGMVFYLVREQRICGI